MTEGEKTTPLSDKQRRFAEEYTVDNNAKNAAVRAGYSEHTAASQGARLLADPRVRALVRSAQRGIADRTKVDADYVTANLTEVLNRCLQAKPVVAWNKMEGRYEETGEWQFDSGGANKALELLGKHVGMFQADKREQRSIEDMTAEELLALARELKRRRDAGLLNANKADAPRTLEHDPTRRGGS